MRKILTTIFAFVMLTSVTQAQQFPVQVTPQLLPPYSVQLSDYYSLTAAGAKLNLSLLLRDFNKPRLNVRLRMSIEGQSVSLRTRADATFQTSFDIEAGVPKYVDPTELAEYFNADKLDFSGISREQYMQTGKLPEGFYTFCFEVIEIGTNQVVSNKGCAFAWMTLSEPPMLNLPRKAEGVVPTNPQNLLFQWTPRHTASPTAPVNATEYIFSLVEITDDAIAPEAAILSNTPLYTETINTTTTLLYDGNKPALVPNKKYAWRVQVKIKDGLDQGAEFRNNGYSETFWFTYKNNCTAPIGAGATLQGQRVNIEWTQNPIYLDYKVEYRETNNDKAEWFSVTNTASRISLSDLKPNTTYQYRVGGSCENGSYTFGDLLSFKTNLESVSTVANCGVTAPDPAAPQPILITELKPGDEVTAGDYKVIVTQASGQSSFNGEGYVKMSWLGDMKIGVRLIDITVNTDKKLVSGKIETTYDPTGSGIVDVDEIIDYFTAGYGIGGVVTGDVTADTTLNVSILWPGGISATPLPANYDTATGIGPVPINIIPAGGAPFVYTADKLPTTIMDKDGNIYQVSKDGSVKSLGKKGGEVLLAKTNKNLIDDDKARVDFVTYDDPKVKFAFDEWKPIYKQSGTFNKEYERIRTAQKGDYYVNAKSIAPATTDYIKARVRLIDSNLKPDSIQFVSGKGIIYTSTKLTDSTYEVAVVGGPEKDAQEIYAVYPQAGGKTLNLGKLLVASYPKKEYKIKIIPVNGASVNTNLIKQWLDSIYLKLNINFTVSQITGYSGSAWDMNNDGLLELEKDYGASSYTREMKALNNAYRIANPSLIEPDAFYLFAFNKNENNQYVFNNEVVNGQFPRGRQFGYLFNVNTNAEVGKTMAHEIAHGLFTLKHTFEYGNLAKGDLRELNLMDYPNGNSLSKFQWDILHDPATVVIGLLENSDDAKSQVNDMEVLKDFKNKDLDNITFMAPNGEPITLKFSELESVTFFDRNIYEKHSSTQAFKIPIGTLASFKLKGQDLFNSYATETDFFGYRQKKDGASYTDALSFTVPASSRKCVISYPCFQYNIAQPAGQLFLLTNNQATIRLKIISIPFTEATNWPSIAGYIPGQKKNSFDNNYNLDNVITAINKTKTSEELFDDAEVSAKIIPGYNYAITFKQETIDFLSCNVDCKDPSFTNEVLQIANFIEQEPGLYSAYLACKGGFGINSPSYQVRMQEFFRRTNPACSTCKAIQSFPEYKRKVTQLIAELTKYKEDFENINTTIESWSQDKSGLIDFLGEKLCSKTSYKILTASARIKILNVLSEGNITGCWMPGTSETKCAEGQLIYTLMYTPDTQVDTVINELAKNQNKIFIKLYKDVSNHGLGEYNFDKFIEVMVKLTTVYNKAQSPEDLMKQGNLIIWKQIYNDWGTTAPINWQTRYFGLGTENGQFKIATFVSGVPNYIIDDYQPKTLFSPFEMVVFVCQDDYKIGGEVVLPKDSIVVYPAFLLDAMSESASGKTTARLTILTVKSGLLVLSLYATAGTSSYLAAAFATADAFSLAADIVLNDLGYLNSLKGPNGEETTEYRAAKLVNDFCQVYSLFRLGHATFTGVYKLGGKLLNYSGIELESIRLKFTAINRAEIFDKLLRSINVAKKILNSKVEILTTSALNKFSRLKEFFENGYTKLTFYADELSKLKSVFESSSTEVQQYINGLSLSELNLLAKRILSNTKSFIENNRVLSKFTWWVVNGVEDDLAKAFINGWTKEKILALPKGSRPLPSEYLKPEYIAKHLEKFEDGASYLVPKSSLDNYGRNLIGRPDGQFVMSKIEMDNLLTKANGNSSVIETELGIPSGLWKNKDLVRIDIPNPNRLKLRMPAGSETGANELWLPGGKLPKGYLEAVTDQIPQGSYTETLTNIK